MKVKGTEVVGVLDVAFFFPIMPSSISYDVQVKENANTSASSTILVVPRILTTSAILQLATPN